MLDILTFSMMFGMFIYVFISYNKLPQDIPIHFNAAGEADGWGNKSTLFGLMLIQFHVVVLCFVLNYFLVIRSPNTKDSLQLINIPFGKKDDLTEQQIAMIKLNTARMFAIINAVISFMFAAIYYSIVKNGLGEEGGLSLGVEIAIILLLAPMIYYGMKIYQGLKTG